MSLIRLENKIDTGSLKIRVINGSWCCKLYCDLNRRTFPFDIVIRCFAIWVTEFRFTVHRGKFRTTLGTNL
jgi:hypothetical protein